MQPAIHQGGCTCVQRLAASIHAGRAGADAARHALMQLLVGFAWRRRAHVRPRDDAGRLAEVAAAAGGGLKCVGDPVELS